MHTQKILHTLLFSSVLLVSFVTPAAAADGIDPRCMTLDDCKTMRAQIGVPTEELEDGFQTRADSAEVRRACPETMFGLDGGEQKEAGLCLPSQAAETKIAIGGKTTFLSLAEYIAHIYRYSMYVAGALCVLLFIVAGIEWTMSGGDGSRIDSAKTRISNAITGLILMATSYVVLYTVDPNLTTLKPPEVYMVRGADAFGLYCSDIANEEMLLGMRRNLNTPDATPTNRDAAQFTNTPSTTQCGYEYHISASEGQYCIGDACPNPGDKCLPFTIQNNEIIGETYSCQDAANHFELKVTSFSQGLIDEILGQSGGGLFDIRNVANEDWLYNVKIIPICKSRAPGTSQDTYSIARDVTGRAQLQDLPSGTYCSGGSTGTQVCNQAQNIIGGTTSTPIQTMHIITSESLSTHARSFCDDPADTIDNLAGYLIRGVMDLTGLSMNKTIILGKDGKILSSINDLPSEAGMATQGENLVREYAITNQTNITYTITDDIISSLRTDLP